MLPDVLEPNLRVVFCGTAAGSASARAGAYYAGPGNSFWRTIHAIGLTPRQLRPQEFRELPRFGIGLTDLCKAAAGSDREVGTAGFDVTALVSKLERYRPDIIAFNGKTSAHAALEMKVDYGLQRATLGGCRVVVLPSTSGAARGFWDEAYWQYLTELIQ